MQLFTMNIILKKIKTFLTVLLGVSATNIDCLRELYTEVCLCQPIDSNKNYKPYT
jgi:hypothetical protein